MNSTSFSEALSLLLSMTSLICSLVGLLSVNNEMNLTIEKLYQKILIYIICN